MFCWFLILFVVNLSLHAQVTSPDSQPKKDMLRVGAATSKITPPIGSIMGITIAEGVCDDLYAKALVLEKGDVKAVLIALDLISLPYEIVIKTRELIEQQIGIPKEHVMMTATHLHAGPQMNPLFWEAVGGSPKQKSEAYVKGLPKMIVESVRSADDKLQAVRVSTGTVQEHGVNHNRRFLMEDGNFRMNPGRLNPDKVRPAGPVDPDVSVIKFESLTSKPVAILANFALHVAVVEGNCFTADFPGKISELITKAQGEEVVTIFTNGTSGNINHIDVTQPGRLDANEESTRIGTILAADVLKALSSMQSTEISSLQARTQVVELPIPAVQHDEVEWAEEVIRQYGKSSISFSDVVEAWRILDLEDLGNGKRSRPTTTVPLTKDGRALHSEIQVIALGNEIALVGFPGDAFVEIGLGIKLNSPFPFTVVNEQSGNGTLSYVPNRKAFSEGGYEVNSARFSPGGGELLVETTIAALIELFPYSKLNEND